MDGKDLRKLSRKQLLEILLAQVTRIEKLEEELEKKNKELSSKKVAIKESGSIAEASLKLSGIFEVAQQACDDYIKNIEDSYKNIEHQAKKEVKDLKNKMLEETKEKCRKMEKKSEDRIKKLEEEIKNLEVQKSLKKSIKTTSKKKTSMKKGK